MKRFFYLMISVLVLVYACTDDNDGDYATYPLSVQLTYPAGSEFTATEGIRVHLVNTITGAVFDTVTNVAGRAEFIVPAGLYEVSVTDVRSVDGAANIFNGLRSNITVARGTDTPVIQLALSYSKSSQVLIKELYVGGCPKDDGSGSFIFDRYVLLYNNSAYPASLDSIVFGMSYPYNSSGGDAYYDDNGQLSYENEGWLPAGSGIWYFTSSVTLEPYSQLVVNINGAIDNTGTYSQSINFNNPDYYCMYDLTNFDNANYYPSPVETIPTSHHLKSFKYGSGNAWVLSNNSPAFLIFTPKDVSLATFSTSEQYADPESSTYLVRKKLPVDWIVDAVEVYRFGYDNNFKRLTATVDAGYVVFESGLGYALYRNVDKAATEALPENAGKLVYNYAGGTDDVDGSTDPSGIDAEASIKNGAHILYKDTNNSSNDFHQRKRASLRDQ
jgi:hypothetical protein